MSIIKQINSELAAVEKKENLTILLAVESGSRAWGFASPDSDYDVRFIYVRPREQYLRLDKRRDVCEWCLDETLDINGWDFDKTLRLLHTSNPTLFEWLSSPIVYRKHPAFDSLMQGASTYFLPKSGIYHYLHMAEGNYREYLKGDIVKLKKYFYVLRPILACQHILAHGTPPPMLFRDLVEAQLEQSLIHEVEELLQMKERSSELDVAPKRQRLNDYIEQSLMDIKENADKLPTVQKQAWEPLNESFLRALEVTGRIEQTEQSEV